MLMLSKNLRLKVLRKEPGGLGPSATAGATTVLSDGGELDVAEAYATTAEVVTC